MGTKKGYVAGPTLTIVGGIVSVISVFLPWFYAIARDSTGITSSISVNGFGSVNGNGILLGLVSSKVDWEFQGIGVLALGIASIAIAIILRDRLKSIAMSACGILIIGGGIVNIQSIGSFSGEFLGATMTSGVGYGLYVVLFAGTIASAGGLLAWRDKYN